MNLTIKAFGAENLYGARSEEGTDRNAGKKHIFGGNLNLADDPVEQRRKEAREQAWNVVKNAWDNDNSVDKMIDDRKGHYQDMMEQKAMATEILSRIEKERESLIVKNAWDNDNSVDKMIDDRKGHYQDMMEQKAMATEILSRIEKERESLMEQYGVDSAAKEYTDRIKALDEETKIRTKQLIDAQKEMRADTAGVRGIQQERLKSAPMQEAQEASEEIMENANEEIIGTLISESKEHIDEKRQEMKEEAKEAMEEKKEREEALEERKLERAIIIGTLISESKEHIDEKRQEMKEEAKEAMEEKKEREEALEERKLERAMQEALVDETGEAARQVRAQRQKLSAPQMDIAKITELTQNSSVADEVGQNLDEIKNEMKLLEADLKGIKVDEQV